jgi:hypothetical protein
MTISSSPYRLKNVINSGVAQNNPPFQPKIIRAWYFSLSTRFAAT